MADPLEIVPDPKVTGRWADEADAEAETQAAATTSEEVALDSLTIEATRRVNNEVSDPDDSRIEAVTAGDTIYASAKKFEDLNLSPELLKGLYVEMKFEKPSKIQAISLPMILTPPFKNLVAQAHNGSGKTTCFVLGMLSRTDTKLTVPQALCICPTRELAIQNMEVLLRMGKFTGITSELAIPADSSNYLPVRKRPPITAQVVIGTPGTISNLVTLKKLSMSFMKILVFDEADHMLAEGGFRDDSRKIMKAIIESSPDCQVLLFSATFNDAVRAFVDQTIKDIFNKDCNQMFVKKEELSLASVKQYKVNCPDELTKVFFEAASLSQKVNCPDDLTKVFFEAASLRKQFSIFYNIRKTANRVIRAAIRSRCHYVNKKWLDGMLTNWSTTETRLQKFRDLRMEQKTGILNRLPKRDAAMVVKDKILELGDRVGQTIIFVRTWKSAGMLHHSLVDLGYEVTTIQGALKQEDRDKIIKEFKEGLTSVLISTDVLARGFDQAQVNLVVNYDLPVDFNNPSEPDYEVYLHRVGRAGRFGRRGAVFNLLCDDRDKQLMEKIEKYFNCEIAEVAQWNSDEDFRDALKKAGLV